MLYGIKQIMIDKRRLKLILGILFIFLVTNVCFADFNWKLMGKAGNGDKYFIDLSSIQKHKQMRNYIRLRDYAITDSHGENSSIIFIETNCEDQTVRFLKDVYFKGNMGNGEYVVLEERGDWQKFESESIGGSFTKFVCSQ
tara:strand:- start:910 stop:1332 length:423 start_codon:yes stop_codon:yes gene_type:complete